MRLIAFIYSVLKSVKCYTKIKSQTPANSSVSFPVDN